MDDWKEFSISREGSVATTRQATEEPILHHDAAVHLTDLAAKGSTVSIVGEDDPVYDFYLLKVMSDGETLLILLMIISVLL